MKLINSIFLIFILIQSVKGQELYGKYLDHEQGLLSNECYDINYDEKGYLIVGTQFGPMKYDGEKFIPICTNLPIERRIIHDFEKDPKGNTYLLNSKNEIFLLQNDKAIHIGPKKHYKPGDPDYRFIKLNYVADGFYIHTYAAYLKYTFKSKTVQPYYIYQTGNELFKFTYNSENEFSFIRQYGKAPTNGDIQIDFPESNQTFLLKKSLIADSREDQIVIDNTRYLLISNKLFKKKGNHVTPLDFNRILFMEHFHNRLWLCTTDGLIELDLEGRLVHHHFKGNMVGGVAPLESGGVAVSFNQKGVFISSDMTDRIHYNFTATSVAHINQEDLVGNLNGAVYRYSNHKLENVAYDSPFNSLAKRFYEDGIFDISQYKDFILLSSFYGMSVLSKDFKNINTIKNVGNGFYELFTEQENLYLTSRVAISKITWKNFNSLPFPYQKKAIPISFVNCHTRLNDSIVLLGTRTGLFKLNLKTDSFTPFGPFRKEQHITDIHVTGPNKLLISTRFNGIYLLHNNKVKQKIHAPCISISQSLLFKNQLIVRGNDGIYIKRMNQLKNNTWFKFFSGECKKIFTLKKKLLISHNNNLIIRKLTDQNSTFKPKILLSKFQLGELEINKFPERIPPNTAISVDIDVLSFDAGRIGLYYKLEGENTISQFTEGTKINFDVLKSGHYQLQIYPVINGKVQFQNSKQFQFTVEKTFWESTIFYILALILLVSIIISFLLLINLRRRKRSAQRSELESKLNEYKLLAVKAQVNPHFLSNGLAAIQALILKGDNDKAAQYLAKFSFLMRKILYYSETQFIPLKQELELVDAYLELELLRFRNRFNIQKEIRLSDKQLDEFQFPSLLLQPILENAIWHGLKFQENNPKLLISFSLNENRELVAQINDNGPGFNTSNQSEEHLSKGNQLITERIDTLNQQFKSPVASIKITSSTSGTSVIFIFNSQLYQSKPL